jgi:hypothetical protein
MNAVIDNDVLLKGACYGLLREFAAAIPSSSNCVGVLGAARFVVPKKIQKIAPRKGIQVVMAALSDFLSEVVTLEPSVFEQTMAAELEVAAQKLGVNLDSGESQLCAIVALRQLPMLLTGDKRAIEAIEKLLDVNDGLLPICGKVKCLEQLIACVLAMRDGDALRQAICDEPEIDKALSICFSCRMDTTQLETIGEGLASYINAVRARAGRALAPS